MAKFSELRLFSPKHIPSAVQQCRIPIPNDHYQCTAGLVEVSTSFLFVVFDRKGSSRGRFRQERGKWFARGLNESPRAMPCASLSREGVVNNASKRENRNSGWDTVEGVEIPCWIELRSFSSNDSWHSHTRVHSVSRPKSLRRCSYSRHAEWNNVSGC